VNLAELRHHPQLQLLERHLREQNATTPDRAAFSAACSNIIDLPLPGVLR
jgi:hypothetical protein